MSPRGGDATRLDREDALLLVVDVQETLFRLCIDREVVEQNLTKLIRAATELGLPRLVTEQYPKGLGPTSAGIVEALGEHEAIPKTAFSCIAEPAFRRAIGQAGRGQVILCGIESHICIYQTARDLLGSGWTVHVVADAISSRESYDMDVALERMRDEGVVVTTTELVIYDLLGDAGTAEFKRLLPLLKE